MKVLLLIAILVGLAQASSPHLARRQTAGECSTAGKKESSTECCGKLFRYSYYGGIFVTYNYMLSVHEIEGKCCREDFVYSGATTESLSQEQLDAHYPGHCHCDDTASECHNPEPTTTVPPTTTAAATTTPTPDPCTIGKEKADKSECCGRLFLYDYGYQKYGLYLPTPQESSGSCCRVKQMPYSSFVNFPEETPGECYCDSSESVCFDEVTTTTAEPTTTTAMETTTTTPEMTTTTTPEPTTTTTPEPTTTTTTPEPTTTTTTPEPTTTTTPEPTTTTTPLPTTSTTPAPLCPALPKFEGRVLGGTAVDECTVDGVLKLGTENRQLCNGVYVFSSTLPVPTIYLPKFCKQNLDQVKAANITSLGALTGEYNTVTFNPTEGDGDIVYTQDVTDSIVAMLPKPGILETGSCQEPACAYDPNTMSSAINFDDCFLTSFGADSISGGVPDASGSLNKVTVTKGTGCTTPTAGAECFVATDAEVKSCAGDVGAPVYCPLDTGETVLYGLVDLTPECDKTGNFPVLPIAA